MSSSMRNILMLLVVTAFAGSIAAVPKESTRIVRDASGGTGPGIIADEGLGELAGDGSVSGHTGADGGSGSGSGGGASGGSGSKGGANGNLACAPGKNGGSTDGGVTGGSISLASTMVTSGPGSTFLGLSRYGMEAVVAKVNAAGGICGRQLKLQLANDDWDANRGLQYLRNYINGNVFALPVVPSSEGLKAAGKDIAEAGTPVIGSDGMLIDQYQNPWIWPVATATVSQVRIMAKYAYDRGARGFAIVYDRHYRFGEEGKDAYKAYVSKLPGATYVTDVPVEPGQPGYGPQIDSLNKACNTNDDDPGDDKCDAVIMLVDPGTAEVWIAGDDRWVRRAEFRLGASPLFNSRFGQNCRDRCDGMVVFTGYVPALEANTSLPGIQQYINDVKAIKPDIDTSNQFLQGAYLGMTVFVEALRKVGPDLTREALRDVMDSMSYTSDLSAPLQWKAGKHFANTQAQAWSIQAPASFDGFRDLRTGWLPDPGL